jgi:copper transport protein
LTINFCFGSIFSLSSKNLHLILITCLVSLVGFGAIHTSFGHAFVLSSNPSSSQSLAQSPQQVNVFFSEPVDLRFSHLKVLDSNGKEVDKGDVHHLQNDESTLTVSVPLLKDGTYTVSTNVLSQTDGHVTDNAFVFGIGEAVVVPKNLSATTTTSTLYLPEAIARFPTLVAQVMIVGAAFGTLWIWKPLSKISSLTESISQIRNRVSKRLAIYYVVASIILVSSNFAILFFQAISINGSLADVLGTRFGTVLLERSIISFILLGLSLFELRQFRKSKSYSFSAMENAGFLIIGIILLVTTSLIGHGASSKQLGPIIIDFIHNLVASLWIGGTFYLAFVLIPKLQESTMNWYNKLGTISVWIPRQSALVVTLLGIIFITGPFLLYILEDNLDLVIGSLYGTVLIAKLTIAGLMVILGGYSSIFIQKHVVKSLKVGQVIGNKSNNPNFSNQSESERNAESIVNKFRKALVIESILGIALLLSVGLLVNTGVPKSEVQNQAQAATEAGIQNVPFETTRFLDNGTKVDLSISPFEVGNNNFKVSFLDMNGEPIDLQSAQIKYSQIEESIGPITVALEKQSRGIYSVNATFGIPGTWDLEVQGIPAKQNMSGIVASFDNLIVKPNFDQLKFNVTEYPISNTTIQPLYPIYDKSRNYIWFGDTSIGSGRIFAFDINNRNYIEHKINGTNIVTLMTIDSKNNLWYVDPLTKAIGSFDPTNNASKLYPIPNYVTPSGIAIDSNDTIWITSPVSGEVMRFDPAVGNITLKLNLKDKNVRPFAIASDPVSNLIWLTDEGGKLAKIDPSTNYSITEYSPMGNRSLLSPTALLIDKNSGEIYISQHDGHRITVFNPLTKIFTDLPIINKAGLPFGMAFDKYGNLWVAEHTINKNAVIDTQKSRIREVPVKAPSPFIQWITTDSNGNIWFAEQRGNSIGMIEPSAGSMVQQLVQEPTKSSTSNTASIVKLDINYQNFVAPAILVGIIISAFMYARSIMDLKTNISIVKEQ